jgi:hypothetical protein
MRVEILHIEDCANWEQAGKQARAVLDALGKEDTEVEYRLLRTRDEAAAVWFAGSPTILIDGTDAFPSGGRTSELACRLYYTDAGIGRLPTVEQLTRVFQEHFGLTIRARAVRRG